LFTTVASYYLDSFKAYIWFSRPPVSTAHASLRGPASSHLVYPLVSSSPKALFSSLF